MCAPVGLTPLPGAGEGGPGGPGPAVLSGPGPEGRAGALFPVRALVTRPHQNPQRLQTGQAQARDLHHQVPARSVLHHFTGFQLLSSHLFDISVCNQYDVVTD